MLGYCDRQCDTSVARLFGVKSPLEVGTMFDRITRDPNLMNGQPCIRGMRITVRRVLEAMATYSDHQELLAEYPELEPEDLQQALEFAAASLDDRVVDFSAAL